MIVPQQKCNECGGWFDSEVGFRLNPHGAVNTAPDRRATCKGCEGKRRQEERKKDPFVQKARFTIRHHAKRYGLSAREFTCLYGWHIERVAHQLRHAYDNTCQYCRRPYSEMRNGPSDITMDIRDPNSPPYLDTNTITCCRSCNSTKANLSLDVWERTLRYWREWESQSETQSR